MNTEISDTVYGIGVDTGGTYTDAVLLYLRRHQAISDIEAFLLYLTMGTIIRFRSYAESSSRALAALTT